MDLVEVLGKKNRKVPVILTKSMSQATEVLIDKRNDVGIPEENPYLFACVCISQKSLKNVVCLSIIAYRMCKILV